jgi:hypothetical protein
MNRANAHSEHEKTEDFAEDIAIEMNSRSG